MVALEEFKNHITQVGTSEVEGVDRSGIKSYTLYECDYCEHEFRLQEPHDKSILYKKVKTHIQDEHPEVLERDEYPNEQQFKKWADKVNAHLDKNVDPGEPLVAHASEMDIVQLHPDGMITIQANRVLGGRDNDVHVSGDRLYVDGEDYISRKTFPVFDNR